MYTCACFYEPEWLPSHTQTRQRKRPFSYLKRRRRNNYHCCLSVSSLFAISTIFHRATSSLRSVHFSLTALAQCALLSYVTLTICLSTFRFVSLSSAPFCYFLYSPLASHVSSCLSPPQLRRATQVAPLPKVVPGVGGVKRLRLGDWCKINFVSGSA